EHVWIEDAGFEDDMIVGTVSSEPNQLPEIAKGDWITVSAADISDWVYRHRGHTFGGFTVKLMQRRGQKWECVSRAGLTNRWSQLRKCSRARNALAAVKSTFDFMKQFSMFAVRVPASGAQLRL